MSAGVARAAVAVLASVVLASCAPGLGVDLDAAREYDAYPLYWLGERFEEWELEHVSVGPGGASFIYGDCTPEAWDSGCAPPLEIQIAPLCEHLEQVAAAPIWERRHVRGAPVGNDGAPVMFTRRTQIKVYVGEGPTRGAAIRALRSLRSINDVKPVIGPTGRIPAPPRAVLAGPRPCRAR